MAVLLSVSGERIALEPNRSYLVGRGLDCDVVVSDMISSRHHARITVGDGDQAILIEDLNSRNGTFVNEERVANRKPIEIGTRIRIGASLYLLAGADPAKTEPDEDMDPKTISLENLSLGGRKIDQEILRVVGSMGAERTDFAGHLGAFGLIEVLQLLIQTRRSGTLHVALPTGHATVDVRNGEIPNATFQELQGFPALLMLVRQGAGIFWLVEESQPCQTTIRTSASRLLLDLCRALDEANTV